ncbi:protein kinase [Candidatus Halobeggiatoa sp. HSG11]|nr:protein kinase [Candidatus Halobeggiatoa sp. HSG11]
MQHPALSELKQFIDGKLDNQPSEQIAFHLESCPHCVTQLDNLPIDDPLTNELRHYGPLPEELDTKLRNKKIGGYILLEELGRGGMGIVYRAYDEQLNRDIALKIIPAGEYADPEQRLRLRKEAETIAALQHPGIVQIYSVGEQDEVMYIALELLHPGGLGTFSGKREARWCATLLKQLGETLHYAHQSGFIHRDIKPDNILLAPSDDSIQPWSVLEKINNYDNYTVPRLKIIDFGLSKSLDEDSYLTRAGVLVGTPDYMAPEQIPDSGKPVGVGVDIYALGAILYELLTNHHVFEADNIAKKTKMLRDDEPLSPRYFNPKIPKDLETICLKCLRKQPEQRYSSARDLAEDLDLFLRGEPVHARALNFWQKLFIKARRTPIFSSHLASITVLYTMHLFAMWILQEPTHIKWHPYLNIVFIIWLSALIIIQRIYQHRRLHELGEYLYVILPMLLIHVENLMNIGPAYNMPSLLLLSILGAVLIRPHPSMVRFATITAQISFTLFALTSNAIERIPFSTERILLFNLLILLTGIITYLLLSQMESRQRR